MKFSSYIVLFFVFVTIACNNGIWLDNTIYRPKKPNYQLLKSNFEWTPLIDTQYIYQTKHPFVTYNADTLYSCMFFYSDGRMAIDQVKTKNQTYGYEQAAAVGYYRIDGNVLFTEVFMPGQGGFYLKRTAIIEKDLLLFKDQHFHSTTIDSLLLNRTNMHH